MDLSSLLAVPTRCFLQILPEECGTPPCNVRSHAQARVCCPALQLHLARMFKSAFILALWAGVFKGQSNNNGTVHNIYINVINVSDCSAMLCLASRFNFGMWRLGQMSQQCAGARHAGACQSAKVIIAQPQSVLITCAHMHRQMSHNLPTCTIACPPHVHKSTCCCHTVTPPALKHAHHMCTNALAAATQCGQRIDKVQCLKTYATLILHWG